MGRKLLVGNCKTMRYANEAALNVPHAKAAQSCRQAQQGCAPRPLQAKRFPIPRRRARCALAEAQDGRYVTAQLAKKAKTKDDFAHSVLEKVQPPPHHGGRPSS